MATIVTQYDPWREKLAANLGIGLLSDALARGREADAQRKNNALYTKTLEDLGLLGEQTQQFADPLMNAQTLPEGYNDNGWAKTMHDSYTPMTQFNMGTAGLASQPQTANRIPTQMDMMKALAANIADPRFNMINFNDVYTKMFQPTMAAATADYQTQLAEKQRAMQQQFSDALFGANNAAEYGKILNTYLASGNAPKDAINAMQKNYEHMFPHFGYESVNLGNRMVGLATDPLTGNVQPIYDWGIGLSPDKAAQLGFDYDKLNREMAYNYDKLGSTVRENGDKNFLAYQKQAMEQLEKEETAKLAELAEINDRNEATTDPQKRASIDKDKARVEAELNSIRQRKNTLSNELMYNGGFAQRPQWEAGKSVSPLVQGHSATINKWAQHYGVDPDLLATIMQIESNGNPNMNGDGTTVSKAGARGVMQVMPKTAENLIRNYGLSPDILNKLDDTDTNVMLSALLLSELQKQYGAGNLDAILGAYNGGGKGANPKTRVDETRKYVAKGNAVYQRLKGAQPPRMTQPPQQQQGTQTQQQTQQKTAGNSPVVAVGDNGIKLTHDNLVELLESDPEAISKLMNDGFRTIDPFDPIFGYLSTPTDTTPPTSSGDVLFGEGNVHNDYSMFIPERLKALHDGAMRSLMNEQNGSYYSLDPLTQYSLPLRRRSPFEIDSLYRDLTNGRY